ncbi:MAG: formate dehydrogenase accessory sulfurtransferase FdhD [Flavobacteriales bacterium]|nr:formate dehydrogenase accessory sulfurtransferase FdhD [Flavobacteriales bacterium]
MAIDNYQGKKFCGDNHFNVDDNLTVEQALQIIINEETFTITMRTPGDDEDLVRGLLYSEDIYKSENKLNISFSENQEKGITKANVSIEKEFLGEGYSNSRNLLSVSSCGICGKKELEDIDSSQKLKNGIILNIKDLFIMFKEMNDGQPTFHQSGGSHAAAAFSNDVKLLSIREDIGRHNAVDKVIGHLINEQQLNEAKCLIVSGRISYEIVSKAFAAKIPILAAVSAPSTLAVDFAKELGITLLGFCRENKATCYSHPKRLINHSA